MKVRHSILVPTYNQEQFISKALDSIVSQTIEPFEVYVVDDCSTDNTGEIVLEYARKFEYIKYIRHESNMGLIENFNFIKKLPKGDVVSWCSGDDLLDVNILENLNKAIAENELKLTDNFLIISNSVHLYPNGLTSLWDNYSERDKGVYWSRLRQGLSFRGVGFSRVLYDKCKSEKELSSNFNSHLALDIYKGFNHISEADKIVYINEVGGIYRVEVGVTKKRDKNYLEDGWKAMLEAFEYLKDNYTKEWSQEDIRYIEQQKKLYGSLLSGKKLNFSLFLEILSDSANYSKNNDSFKNAAKLLPKSFIRLLKLIYPIYLKLK